MRNLVNRLVVTLIVCAMTSVMALAEGNSKEVTFHENIKVNGTLVKKGTYRATYDEQTNELAILKNNKVIAKASARLEKLPDHSRMTYATKQGSNDLFSVTLNHGNLAVINDSNKQAATMQ